MAGTQHSCDKLSMMLRLLTVLWASTSAFAPRATRNSPLTRRQFTEVPEALETARFVRVDPENTETKPVLLALGGLDGSPRVGARNWKRLGEWFDVRALVLDCVEINQCRVLRGTDNAP